MKETIDKIRAACRANRTPLLFLLLFIAAFAVVNGREIAQEVSATYSAGGTGDAGNGTLIGETLTEGESDAADSQPGTGDGTVGDEGADDQSGSGSAGGTAEDEDADSRPGSGSADGTSGDEDADGGSGSGSADGTSGDEDADGGSGSGSADGTSGDEDADGRSQDGAASGKSGAEGADGRSGNGDADSISDGGSGSDGSERDADGGSGVVSEGAGEDGEPALTQEELSRHERRLLSQMGSSFRIPMNMPERLRSGYVLAEATGSQSGTARAEMLPDETGNEDGQSEKISGDASGDAVNQSKEMSGDADGDADVQSEEMSGDADGDADAQSEEMFDDVSGNTDMDETGNEETSDAEDMLAKRLKDALADRSGHAVLRDVSVSNALFEDEAARMPELVRSDGAVLYELEDPVLAPYMELYNWRYLRGCEILSPEQAAWYGITVKIPDGLVEYKGKYDIYEIRDLSVLQTMLETKISEYDGVWSVYVKNLTSGDSFVLNDNPMKSASVMKLFVMGTVYKAFESGELERTDEVMALVSNMIINSDNESTNQLLYRLGDSDYEEGIRKVDEFIAEYGFSDMTVEYNGFENPDTVTVSGSYNQVAAKDCGKLLEDIYRRTWTSRSVSNEMEQLLLSQGTRYKIPAGLPEGVLCGNKTGEMNTTENDAAIIYGEGCDYVLVVLSSDWASKDQAISRIQEISRTVYEFLN